MLFYFYFLWHANNKNVNIPVFNTDNKFLVDPVVLIDPYLISGWIGKYGLTEIFVLSSSTVSLGHETFYLKNPLIRNKKRESEYFL